MKRSSCLPSPGYIKQDLMSEMKKLPWTHFSPLSGMKIYKSAYPKWYVCYEIDVSHVYHDIHPNCRNGILLHKRKNIIPLTQARDYPVAAQTVRPSNVQYLQVYFYRALFRFLILWIKILSYWWAVLLIVWEFAQPPAWNFSKKKIPTQMFFGGFCGIWKTYFL